MIVFLRESSYKQYQQYFAKKEKERFHSTENEVMNSWKTVEQRPDCVYYCWKFVPNCKNKEITIEGRDILNIASYLINLEIFHNFF